jgi:putative membrane protein
MDILAVSLKGVVPFLLYFVAAVALLSVFLAVYAWITPYREIELIRKGDTAAAVSLSGAMLGFAIPLASAIAHAVVVEEMLMWGAISLLVQLAAYVAASRILPDLARRIPEGSIAHGTFLAALSVAVGLLNAACMVY